MLQPARTGGRASRRIAVGGQVEPGPAEPESRTRAETVVIGNAALATLYAVLTPLHLLVLTGVPRTVMTALAAASAGWCAAAWWRMRRLDRSPPAEAVDRALLAMCAVPLINSLTHLGVSARLDQTTVVMLSIVGIAAVNPHRRQVVPLLSVTVVAWVVLVWWAQPEPRSQVVYTAIELALAVALAAAVFTLRARVSERLSAARRALATQLADAVRLRDTVASGEQRFRSVFENSPVAISLSDEQGHFVEVNAALGALLGRPADQVLGRSAAAFTHTDDLATQHNAGHLIETAPDGVAKLEKRYVRPDGEVRWGWLTMRHVPGPHGETYTLAHIQDVTDRKAQEEQLRHSREAMAAIAAIASASQRDDDARPIALSAVRSLSGARATVLFEPTTPGMLEVTATCGDDTLLGARVSLDEAAVTTQVFASGQGRFVPHARRDPDVNTRLLGLVAAGSVMWEPVVTDGDVVAVIVAVWEEAGPRVSDMERQAVTTLAAKLSSALQAEDMRGRLQRATVTDPLTGLLNRRGWEQRVAGLVAHSTRSRQPITVALIDLDHFKRFNDAHGHGRGDEALAHFAARAEDSLRAVDAIARWGGEEFAVALRDTDAEQAAVVLDRLRASAGDLTCSIGFCTVPPGRSIRDGLARADRALYAAKQAGRDRVHCADAADPAGPTAQTAPAG